MCAVGATIALAMGVSTLSVAWSQTPRADPCVVPDALLRAGDGTEARKEYVAVVRQSGPIPCALRGLKETAAGIPPPAPVLCEAGDASFDEGDLDGATREYRQLGRESTCAASGLTAVREVLRLCAEGDAHLANHQKGEALKAYQGALAKNPRAECATDGIEEAGTTAATRALNWVTNVLPDALFVVGLLCALIFLLLLLGHFRSVWQLLVQVPLIRALLGPRLELKSLDDDSAGAKVGAAMAAHIRERLQRYHAETLDPSSSGHDNLDLASTRDEFATLVSGSSSLKGALGQVREVSAHGAFISALLNLLYFALPVRRLSVSGVLDPPDSRAATTLTLQDGARLAAATTITGTLTGGTQTAPSYLRLAQPAAVWVQYEVARNLSGETVKPDDAESYALVRQGLQTQLDDEDAAGAIVFYEEALILNRRNWAAWVNLAAATAEVAKDASAAARSADIALRGMEEMEKAGPG